MLSLLLLLLVAQAPAVPGEGTLVSFCKQGRLSSCQELAKINPEKAREIQAELAKSALRREALKVVEEEGGEKEDAEANASSESKAAEAEASDEPPNCKGQNHHIISRPIAKALEDHKTLRGLYEPRDERLKTQAKDKESHCGYQQWHRDVDAEVIKWLENNPAATPAQLMAKLREIYNRPEMLERFPHGF
ncbi:Wall-associated protein precursor [Hyalangium rubrum]|uniref:Wall-associated protein n=1 Tax=Hyalangium rubrum TaxID=3103134 RepID=A0ABU5HBA7_9BACT|nr:Wall-associated protein precursor [Hyalangium sp. s54d21]MDY7230159.1 Wall-associated protein precursor [Hyalangium sp. s54d21]